MWPRTVKHILFFIRELRLKPFFNNDGIKSDLKILTNTHKRRFFKDNYFNQTKNNLPVKLSMGFLILMGLLCSRMVMAEPVIFFSDLDSGPVKAYVTVYGKGFGPEAGKISVGGTSARVLSWTDNGIEFQVASGSGNGIQITSAKTEVSNIVPFVTRPGRIYFVSQIMGSDKNSGDFENPWRSLKPILKRVKPGDIVYIRSGHYKEVLKKSWRANFFVGRWDSGKLGKPIALVGYPGEAPLIGTPGKAGAGRVIIFEKGVSDWTIAKLRITGKGTGINVRGDRFRVIGNEIFDMLSSYGSLSMGGCNDCQVFGNHIHDSGKPGSKLAHLIYYEGGKASNVNIAWNLLHDEQGGRCIQFYGHNNRDSLSGLSIHNNIAYNCPYDGILVGRTDAKKKGWIQDARVFNNIVYNSGFKGDSGALRFDSEAANVQVFNNTLINNNSSIRLMRARKAIVKDNLSVLANDQEQHVRIAEDKMGEMLIEHNRYIGGDSAPRRDLSPDKSSSKLAKEILSGSFPNTPDGFAFGVPQMDKIKVMPLPAQQGLFQSKGTGFNPNLLGR